MGNYVCGIMVLVVLLRWLVRRFCFLDKVYKVNQTFAKSEVNVFVYRDLICTWSSNDCLLLLIIMYSSFSFLFLDVGLQ